ncbi:hypothetical protein [Caviibacter abscessus]|uniref:hypothetical protein n=1 Tax=Caviibacter abscessus TaxID=1766719 RepID=UPI0008396076|nr:hypothetical protein [Caviibacter abscessus]
MKGLRTQDINMQILMNDVTRYFSYFEPVPLGMGGLTYKINLPFSKGRDEHPYWLVEKIDFIFYIYCQVKSEK